MHFWAKEETADTTALTEVFLEMDAALSKAQVEVDTYHTVTADHSLDTSWNAVLTRCEEATAHYLSVTAPGACPTWHTVEYGKKLVDSAIKGVEAFRGHYSHCLNEAANQAMRLAEEAQRAREEAARRAAALPGEVSKALSSVSTRLEAARTRIVNIQPALSSMFKEFVSSSSVDLMDNQAKAQDHVNLATDYLGRARATQHNGNLEGALQLAQEVRRELSLADQLIDAVPQRLRLLREIRDDPKKRSEPVWFALHDAQMFMSNHGLTKQWASVLDAQSQRIQTLEATLSNAIHPDYWAYATGLNLVKDFIASQVAKMRDELRK
jgi:hypothetical protein